MKSANIECNKICRVISKFTTENCQRTFLIQMNCTHIKILNTVVITQFLDVEKSSGATVKTESSSDGRKYFEISGSRSQIRKALRIITIVSEEKVGFGVVIMFTADTDNIEGTIYSSGE